MRERIHLLNNISLAAFSVSSLSLLGTIFTDRDGDLTGAAYLVAAMFWLGLISGIVLQICAYLMCKKLGGCNMKPKRARRYLIPVMIFLISSILILIFRSSNIVLASADLALLLFSTEIYFYFKRRYSI